MKFLGCEVVYETAVQRETGSERVQSANKHFLQQSDHRGYKETVDSF